MPYYRYEINLFSIPRFVVRMMCYVQLEQFELERELIFYIAMNKSPRL
jgi:hypothetical protein